MQGGTDTSFSLQRLDLNKTALPEKLASSNPSVSSVYVLDTDSCGKSAHGGDPCAEPMKCITAVVNTLPDHATVLYIKRR